MEGRRKELGQYFTTDPSLLEQVCAVTRMNGTAVLEPSCGRGHVVAHLLRNHPRARDEGKSFDLVEIDRTVELLDEVAGAGGCVRFHRADFLAPGEVLRRTYDTIVGNPPFVRRRGQRNLYIEFVARCFDLLAEGGELVFIVPANMFRLTSARRVLRRMLAAGSFTHVRQFADETMFSGAHVTVMVFRYERGRALGEAAWPRRVVIGAGDGLMHYEPGGVPTVVPAPAPGSHPTTVAIGSLFDAYVAPVTGCDAAFRPADPALGNVRVLCKRGVVRMYIRVESLPSGDGRRDAHLQSYKTRLLARRGRRFDETNWFRWATPRNLGVINESLGRDCAFVSCVTRQPVVAFRSTVQFFGAGLLLLLPRPGTTVAQLDACVAAMNSPEFRARYTESGRFRIGQRVLRHARVPAA